MMFSHPAPRNYLSITNVLSDSLYFVIKGRVRTVEPVPGQEGLQTREVGLGNTIGTLQLYLDQPRQSAATATRKSEIAKLQKLSFLQMVQQRPALAAILWNGILHAAVPNLIGESSSVSANRESAPFRTVTVLPLSIDVPTERFVSQLLTAFVDLRIYDKDSAISVNIASVMMSSVGENGYTSTGRVFLEDYLTQLEENTELSILIGDHNPDSTWNDVCLAHVRYISLFLRAIRVANSRAK